MQGDTSKSAEPIAVAAAWDTAGEFRHEASPLSSGRSDMFIETAKCDPQAPSGATSDIFRSDGAWGNIVYISINIPRLWRFETRIRQRYLEPTALHRLR